MSTITLVPTGGTATLDLLGSSVKLTAEGNENLFPPPTYDETYATGPDTEGGLLVTSTPQNPEGQGRVTIRGTSNADFLNNLATWQEVSEQVRSYGGTLTHTPTGGSAIKYTVESFRVTSVPADTLYQRGQRAFSEFEVTYSPYGELAPYTAVTNANGSDPLLEFTVEDVPGSAPAFGKLTLTEQATTNIDHVEVGLADPAHFNPSSLWDYLLTKPDLTATGFAGTAGTTPTGGFSTGGTVWKATLATSAVVVCGTGSQPHIGRHRARARVQGGGTGTVRVRFAWRVGEGEWSYTDKGWVSLPALSNWYEPDLGLFDIPKAIVGSQSWEGRIEAYSVTAGDTLAVDYLKLIPAWRYSKVRTPLSLITPVVFSAQSGFTTESGAITGDSLTVGGTWTTMAGNDADDFSVTSGAARRTAISDVSVGRGLFPSTPTALTNVAVAVDFRWSDATGPGLRLMARSNASVSSMSNIHAVVSRASPSKAFTLGVQKYITGSATVLSPTNSGVEEGQFAADVWYTLALMVMADGQWVVFLGPQGGALTPRRYGYDADLATGGTLASGRVVLYDENLTATACNRDYDNFAAWVPESQHAINSGKTLQLRHDRALAEPASGSNYQPRPVEGGYLLLPIAGREDRATRGVVSHHPFDVDASQPAFDPTNTLRADLDVTPRVLLSGRA